MRKKSTRILAVIGVVLLASLYVSSLIFALIDHPVATTLLKISFVGTIVIPIMLYVYMMIFRVFHKEPEDRDN